MVLLEEVPLRVCVCMYDAAGELESAVLLLEELAHSAAPVLVHCTAGQSRSTAVAALFLMRFRDITLR